MHEDGSRSIGEMYLPYEASKMIVGVDPNIKVKVAGKNNTLKDAYETYREFLLKQDKNLSEENIKESYDGLQLRDLNSFLQSQDPDMNIIGIVTRYPRTRPNDLAFLRIKGFLSKEHGNQTVVNDYDVFSIFEGDYDIDKVDYFWGHHNTTFKHIDRMKNNWVANAPVEQLLETSLNPNLKVMPDHDKLGSTVMGAWNELDANNRVMDKNIGKVQKMLRSVEWMWNNVASDKIDPIRGKQLMEFPGDKGEKIEIYMDMGQKWYHRFAMESQALIDFFKPIKDAIASPASTWAPRFLNPKEFEGGEKVSYTSKEIQDNHIGFESSTNSLSEGGVPRIRLFRKSF